MYDIEWPLMRYPTYQGYSLEVLENLADNFLFCLTKVNHPPKTPVPKDPVCVSAAPGRPLHLNFHSSVIRGWVGSDLVAVEGLTDEAWKRLNTANQLPLGLVNTLVALEHEGRAYLNNLAGCAALNVQDLSVICCETSNQLLHARP